MARKNIVQKEVEKVVVSKQVVNLRTRFFQFYTVLAIATFAQLALLAKVVPYFSWDVSVTKVLQNLPIPYLNAAMAAVSWPGYMPQSWIIAFIILIFFVGMRWYWETVVALISFSGMEVMVLFLKQSIGRIRPLGSFISGKSFPSGHVVDYTVVMGFLLFLTYSVVKKSRLRNILMLTLSLPILLVGPSRIYLGVHWPSDVLGAYLLATIWLFTTIWFYRWGQKRKLVKSAIQQSPGT